LLWRTRVFSTWINPGVEEDVQWVFITRLEVADGNLLVTDERGGRHSVDLQTGRVQRPFIGWIVPALVVALAVAACVFLLRRRLSRSAGC
jgi:hypothetical protein